MDIKDRNNNQRRIQKFDEINVKLSKFKRMQDCMENGRDILKVTMIFPFSNEEFHQDYLSNESEKIIKNEIKKYIQKMITILQKELDEI